MNLHYEIWYTPETSVYRSYGFGDDGDARTASEPIKGCEPDTVPHSTHHVFGACLPVSREWLRSHGAVPLREAVEARLAHSAARKKAAHEAKESAPPLFDLAPYAKAAPR